MRKFLILGIAVVLGGAALLIPAGGSAAPVGNGQRFAGSVTDPITVQCEAGASTGTATYSVSVASTPGNNRGNTGSNSGATQIRVSRAGDVIATFQDIPDSEVVTEDDFPCPTTSSTNGTATFTFRAYNSAGTAVGTADTVTVATVRTGSAS